MKSVTLRNIDRDHSRRPLVVELPSYERERFDDVTFLTAMLLTVLGNYRGSGHFGGPLAYTPYNVASHLGGPALGALSYDLREPKHPFADRFMLAGGHCIPTCYALWMIMYEALARQHEATGDDRYAFDPKDAVLAIDALGFRRSPGAVKTLLDDLGLVGHPLFRQARLRGIRPLMGHAESTDVTNDVNGGPSGIGISTAAGKAVFWDYVGAPESFKIIALEGEFAMTEGHAQELKTAAVAQRVGKRLRILLSYNNAGIDDELVGSVVAEAEAGYYDLARQWSSYGWNVLALDDGNELDQVFAALLAMERWPSEDRRPQIVIGPTVKGWWPAARNGEIPGYGPQLVSYDSHPYAMKCNDPYFVALCGTFENRYGVEFQGIRDGPPASEAEKLVQFKTNVDVVLSVLERDGLGAWIANRTASIGEGMDREPSLRIDASKDPFLDERLAPERLPEQPVTVSATDPISGRRAERTISLFMPPGKKWGGRRAISELGAWANYVTEGRYLTVAADLSGSINVEKAHFFGHYDPVSNPSGTRLKAGIQEAANASTMIGLVNQTVSVRADSHSGLWGVSGTYGAFTPLMYTPARVYSQQNQDSPFRLGVLTILAGHSGPETAADARTHFGIFAPQVWTLFPRGQVVNLYFWDYNDVAPGYFAAVAKAAREPEVGIIVIHVARPDSPVADRSRFADPDLRASSKGIYLIRDYDPALPPMGTVWAQGSSSTVNLVKVLDRLDEEGINVRVASVISPELFADQPDDYRNSVYPDSSRFDSMVVSTMTKRVPPLPDLGPLTEEYSLYADRDDRWLTGGTEEDVIAEAGLDAASILEGIRRFAANRPERLERQRAGLAAL